MYYNNGQWEETEKARVKHLVVFSAQHENQRVSISFVPDYNS